MPKTGLLQFQFQGCSWVVTSLYYQPCDMASPALLQPTKAGLLHDFHFYMGNYGNMVFILNLSSWIYFMWQY